MDRWLLGFDAWVIQDGNYADLQVGDELEFAVDFYPDGIEPVPPRDIAARSIRDYLYEVIARVTQCEDDAWTVDIGIGAYSVSPPPTGIEAGMFIRGRAYLGVDPFLYLEDLAPRPTMPALVYAWRLEQLAVQTAPLIETAPKHFERDESKWGWAPIQRTDAWNDAEGHAVYLLECVLLLPEEPMRKSTKRGELVPNPPALG
jgi:hypothetical protein